MKLFKENGTLKSINDVLITQMQNYSLLGDIPISHDVFLQLASKIRLYYEQEYNSQVFYMFKESLSAFLVFCAVFDYDDRTYWQYVEKYIGNISNNQRNAMYKVFEDVIKKYNLNKFENESQEGFKHVTPILCHAGIPINSYDSYFSAISNTVNDSFYDEFSVEDYLKYLQNKTEITVRRYIKLSNRKDAYNFIQNTRKLIMFDSVDEDEGIENGNYFRMLEQIALWKEKPKVKKTLNARHNVQISAPKIKLDLNGIGVYCEIPGITIKDFYDSYVIWEIFSDESSKLIKADIFKRKDIFMSEEKIAVLLPANTYTISLKIDNNLISKWEFDGIKENYMAFSQNGNIIKSESLPNNFITFLLKNSIDIVDKETLPITELPHIPLWKGYDVYQIDLSNIKIFKCTNCTINVGTENRPVLDGGVTLFKQDNSIAYTTLPDIKFSVLNEGDLHIEIKQKSKEVVISKENIVTESDCKYIMLKSLINKDCYGNYDIKIWHRNGINSRFNIDYVPWSTVKVVEDEYWPSNYQGYTNNTHSIKTIQGVDLELFNAEKVSEINKDAYIEYKYKTEGNDRFLFGEYKYKYQEYEFSTPVKKSIRPVSWGIIGIENEVINLSSKVYTLTLKEFEIVSDPYLLFSFNFEGKYNINYLRFDLVGANKKIIKSENIPIINKDGLRIPMNSYIFDIQNCDEIDYHMRVSLIDSNEMIVSSFLVARIQDEVVIKNSKYIENENNIFITWDEEGTKIGRECIFVNFLKPWLKPYRVKIEDKLCELSISKENLEKGIYKYIIQKESDELFFEEPKEDICSIKSFHKGRIVVNGKKNNSTKIENILHELLKSRFLKKEGASSILTKIENEIRTVKVKIPEDIEFLSYAYILNERFLSNKEDYMDIIKIYDLLFDVIIIYGKHSIKYILDSNFSIKYKKILFHKFYCNNLTTVTYFNDVELKMIADIDENMAGFINLIQSENKSKGLNWAGISDVSVFQKEDLFGESDNNTTFLTDENLGKSNYITQYFKYVSNCILHPKNLSKSTRDFIMEFQKQNKIEETAIFGKTRLNLVVEWRSENKSVKEIQDNLSQILNIPCDHSLRNNFCDVFNILSKRELDDEIGYYIGLIAVYASFIRSGLMEERIEFSRLLNYTISKCEKLYYRDAIVIELYMHLERGFSWV